MENVTALQGLAVIAAIPVVLFALWADYFGRYLDELEIKDPKYNRAIELGRVRVTGLLVLIFEFTLYMVSVGPIGKISPLAPHLVFFAAVALEGITQASLEKRLRQPADLARGRQSLSIVFRAFFWGVFGAGLYVAIAFASIIAFFLVARVAHASSHATTAIMVVGSVVGLLGGLAANFALGPTYLRNTLPVRRPRSPEDDSLAHTIAESFSRSGQAPVETWIIEAENEQTTAMIAGFRSGRGLFRPALMIPVRLIGSLSSAELQAVIKHELSHLQLGHLAKRFAYASALTTGGLALGSVIMLLGAPPVFSAAAGLGVFIAVFKLLARQSLKHEIEADLHAIERLGARFEDLASALRKMHVEMGPPPMLSGLGHPPTERRIARVGEILEQNAKKAQKTPAKRPERELDKAA